MLVVLPISTLVVASLLYLLQPLVSDDVTPLSEQSPWAHDTGSDESGTAPPAAEGAGRPMTDGGQVCQNCGAHLDGEFTYCGECLTPVV